MTNNKFKASKKDSFHGGDALVSVLQAEGCEYVFGIPGGEYMHFLESVSRNELEEENIHYIGVRHEQAAANMADAYSRVSGKVGVCCGTVGPGFANLIPGVIPALFDNIPILVLHPQANERYDEMHRLQQGLNQLDIMKPIVKYQKSIREANKIIWGAQKCFKELRSGRPGPVQLEILEDAFRNQVDEQFRDPLQPIRYRNIYPPPGNPESIKSAVDILAKAEKPLIISGGGVTSSNGWDNLREISSKFEIPVVTSVMGMGTMSSAHNNFIGTTIANAGSLTAANQADVVLALGTKFSFTLGYGKFPIWNPNAKLIQVDIDPQMIGKNRPVDIGILGDCKVVLSQFLQEMNKRKIEKFSIDWLKTLKEARKNEIIESSKFMKSNEEPIHPLRIVNDLGEFANPEDIICTDGGSITYDVVPHIDLVNAREPRTLLTSIGFGHLGVGIPYAIGAKCAKPNARVFCLSGDGSVGFNIQELLTAVQYDIPIIIIVANNGCWGASKSDVLFRWKEREPFCVDFGDIDYAKIAQGFGCYAERVKKPDEIKKALQRAVRSNRPALIDVITKHTTPKVSQLLSMVDSM